MGQSNNLHDNILKNLEAQDINITKTEVEELYTSVLANISEVLDSGDFIEIANFGSFWRKKNGTSIATFFKPDNDILERINK